VPDHAGRDHRAVAQFVERGGQAVLGHVGARGAGHVAHGAQAARDDRQRRFGNDADDDVHLVAQVVGAVLEQHVQHDAGVQPLELDEPVAHHHLAIAAGHADAHAPQQALAQAGHGLARGGQFVADGAAMLVQAQADLGGLDAARAAPDELHARRFFQLRQVVADVGARHLELARRLAEVAAVDDLH